MSARGVTAPRASLAAVALLACTGLSDDRGGSPTADSDDATDLPTVDTDTDLPPDDSDLDSPPDDTDGSAGQDSADTAPPTDTAPAAPAWPVAPGWPGVFVDLSGPLQTDPRFVPDRGLAGASNPPDDATVFWVDLNGDDVDELVVSVSDDNTWEAATQFALMWSAGALVPSAPLTGRLPTSGGLLQGVLDLDGDGYRDLILGGRPHVAWGRLGGAFPTTERIDPDPNGGPGPHALVWDLDADGLLDLLPAMSTCGNDAPRFALHQQGRRVFARRTEVWDASTSAPVILNTYIPTVLPDGRLRLTLAGDVCAPPHPGHFLEVQRTADGMPVFALDDPMPADAWFRLAPEFQPAPSFMATAPMGGVSADIDGDGLFDLIVSGFGAMRDLWLGTPAGGIRSPAVLGPYDDHDANPATLDFPWSYATVDLDGDGRLDVLATLGDDASSFLRQRVGYVPEQRLHWNAGGGVLVMARQGSGFDVAGSYRALVLDDIDGDGDPDALLGGYGDPPRLLRNDLSTPMLGLRLHGTTSNAHGIGATVVGRSAATPPRPAQRHLHGAHGNPQSNAVPITWLSADAPGAALPVDITWPAGWTQTVHLAPGAVRDVVEPATLTVDHPTRRLVAGSGATVTVTLTPRDATGAIDAGATAQITVTGAQATPPRPLPGGGVAVDLTTPAAAGEVWITGLVDGAPLAVRPKLWVVAAAP